MLARLATAALAVLLLGATPYKDLGLGGFTEQAGPGEITIVDFSRHGFVKPEMVSIYLLYRCAELSQQHGSPHFRLYESLVDAIIDRPLSPPIPYSRTSGWPLLTVYMLYEQTAVPHSFAAAEVLAKYESQVKKPVSQAMEPAQP